MSKHTPAPWMLVTDVGLGSGERVILAGDRPVVRACFYDANHAVTAANAHLIAAAPELIAAVELALGEFREVECNCDGEYVEGRVVGHACYFHRIEHELKSALIKATGGSNE